MATIGFEEVSGAILVVVHADGVCCAVPETDVEGIAMETANNRRNCDAVENNSGTTLD